MSLRLYRTAQLAAVLLASSHAFAAAPSATTSPATSITTASAVLNGAGTPAGEQTTGWFRISSTNPGTCDNTFGTRVPASGGTDLGSGSSAVPYSITATGLTSGVTYYFCAIVQNASGTAFGSILSFTVPAAPVVTTSAATGVASTTATLNGSANPGLAATTGWFRYAATNPGTCNDSFGSRIPTSGGSNLGSGSVAQPYSQAPTGLLPGTTYYFCAIAQNANGTSFGSVLTFTTLANAPTVTTSSATLITGSTAQLNGTTNPGGASTTGWFRFSTTNPGTCNDSFGTRAPTSGGTALGSGNTSSPYSLGITGLSGATTYYFCAISQNSVGTSFGNVLSFTTPSAPTAVVTNAASSVSSSSAQLNGSANPSGASTTAWFRYGLTNPGTCNDTFGSRAPVSGGSNLGSGTSSQPFSQSVSGLSAGTTYYFCAIAQNSEGLGFGSVLTFTTSTAPTTTTSAATLVTSTSATLNGSADPNGDGAYGYFRYATTNPGTCSDGFGTRAPSSSSSDSYLGAGTSPVDFSRAIAALTPATTYYFCALGRNAYGTTFGAVLSFTTPPALPTANTVSATALTGTTATLNGSTNPGGASTTGWFRFATASPGTCNDTFGTRAPAAGGSDAGSGNSTVSFNQAVTGLTAGTTYYYCAIVQSSVGTNFGTVRSFVTPTPPAAVTSPAVSIANTSATLAGTGTPNGSSATGWFRYATTNPGTCNDTFGSRAPTTGGSSLGTGYSAQPYSQSISGLTTGVTYYFCAIVQSAEGTSFGSVLSFTTTGAPLTTTTAATGIAATTATMNGTVDPNGDYAYGYFRYSTTNPGSCSDSFGTRVPSSISSDTPIGSGTLALPFSQALSSLTPATTYYFCAIGRNAYGTSFGSVLSFTTLAALPTVSASSASSLTGTTATLNGSGNPGGAETTAWFRFATTSPGTCNDTFGTRAPATGGSSLGSGTSNTAFNQPITGLTPATTYYFCAIAQNSVGTVVSSTVRTFTTPTLPAAVTTAASAVGNTYATLNGTGTPNGSSATGWFRYSATSPGTCNDTFGSRAPTTGGSALGTGSTAQGFSQSISGLTAGATYYFCAIVQTAEGTAFGSVLSFTTATTPVTTTTAATSVTSTTATMNGSAVPNGDGTYGYYRYATTNPGACNDSFGTRVPYYSSSDTYLGLGTTAVTFSQALTGLLPATTYYFCAIGRNAYGTTFGAVLSFTTLPAAPTANTGSATALTGATATLNGSGNPGGAETTGWFRFATTSPGTCNDSFGTRAPATGGSSLGSGNSNTAFSQAITGLSAGTTYYFCAITESSVAKVFGTVQSFVTPTPPVATTSAASSLGNTFATLNGLGDPNGSSATGWFRYGATNPGTCNDTFGSRAPTTGGSSLGSGTSNQSFSQSVTGLTSGVTYYFCAIVQSAEGTSFGAVLSFTTTGAPIATTVAASAITTTTATLNGQVNPNGSAAYGYFRYANADPGACNDSFGTRVPYYSSSDTYAGTGTSPVTFNQPLTGLLPGRTYWFCAIGRNGYGTSFGEVLSFTTQAAAPTVTTSAASDLTGDGATLNGSVNPGGAATTAWFRYSTTSPGTCNDTFGTRAPATGGTSLSAGNNNVTVGQAVTGLTPGTTYYFCALAQNSVGLTVATNVRTFTTPTPPVAVTVAASNVYDTSAYLNGTGNPNGSATTGYFRYGLTNPGTCTDSFGSRAPTTGGASLGSGTSAQSFSQQLTGLSASTTYYFCAVATSAEGQSFGAVLSFTTDTFPTVTSNAATLITSTTAQLNGGAVPNGDDTYAYFRYSTTNPLVCNDSFGSRVPYYSSSDTYLGQGATSMPFSQALTGLTPGTTYYFCAIARNGYGTRFGAVLSFTSQVTLPAVTTSAASAVSTTGATLNGSANPNGANTTAWFRYATASPGTCNDSFGTRAPVTGGSALGGGTTSATFLNSITGLNPGTTYYFCAIAQNSAGTSFGTVRSFTTTITPAVTTFAASPVTATTATLNATVNPNGYATSGWFRYATSNPGACDDSFGTATSPVALGSGTGLTPLSQGLTGLSPATTYWFCGVAQSSIGTSFGALLSFTTPSAPPSITTVAASALTGTTATLNGTGNPNGAATTGWFRFATTNPGTCNDSFGTRTPATGGTDLGSGNSVASFSANLTGLTGGTTYYFCALGQSGVGSSVGTVLSFTTATAPVVTTVAASSVGSNTATLNGTANPNRAATTGWFRYSTTNPGACNDSFGTRLPATGGTDLGSGSAAQTFSQALTGLTMGTTYYYCAIAQNAVGTSFGSVLSFSTLTVPGVTTVAASAIGSTGATLNGSANPNGLASTGYFRYATVDPGICDDTFGVRAPTSGGTSLGSGTTAAPYSRSLTGLSPGTTYYYCALASNSGGAGFGTVQTFTTLAAPEVTTTAATALTANAATLNGSANPKLATATGWFRYSTTNPGTCNDTFGTRAPSSGGTDLGAGSSDVAYSRALTGLVAGTTYYYCALASNSVGTSVGTVMSFTTLAAPVVTTVAASSVTATGATLNGTGTPRGAATTGWFRYSATNPGSCSDTFGTRMPASGGTDLGSGSAAQAFGQALTGLTAGTTYYFCAIAQNSVGTSLGSVLSFVTPATPVVTTSAATLVATTSATLNGSATPRGSATTGWFRYGTSSPGASCNDTFGTRFPSSGGTDLGSGTTAQSFTAALTGLTSATTYYFCAIAQNAEGMAFGTVLSFTTLAAPTVTTDAATLVTASTATLNGSANPNGSAATGWFRYATTSPGATCNDSFGTRTPTSGGTSLGSGSSAQTYARALTGLIGGTTYYFCAIASNSVGTAFGAVQSFTTPGAPVVTTVAATDVTGTTATLNGSAIANSTATTGWFRFATSSPGACNDTFGTRLPVSGGADLGSGTTAQDWSQAVTGLSLGTTYYFCAIAQNANGTRFGTLMSFTTQAAPTVTTVAASGVSGSGATLNGSANPRGLAATGWFRFATTSPGTCNDTFGTRVPAAGGTNLGSGTSAQTFAEPLIGLAPGTTYYFCALAENAAGTSVGTVRSFITPNAPTATTVAASAVTGTTATLNGSANPRGAAATGWFRWSATNPGACDDSFGTRVPATGGTSLGSGNAEVTFSQALSTLTSGTTYWFCAIAQSAEGQSYGALLSFNTQGAPTVTTDPATLVTGTTATINGTANPNGISTTGWFRYATVDPGACNNSFGTRSPTSGALTVGTGTTPISYSRALTGLTAGTTYYFCAIANNASGMRFGEIRSFTTPGAPTVTTVAASAVSGSGATLNGTANPNGSATTGWFRYSTTSPGSCTDAFGTRLPGSGGTDLGSGTTAQAYTQALTGLTPGTTYYFCAIAQNATGLRFGAVLSLTTQATPAVTTTAASAVSGTTATINGSANPRGSPATGWFRYSATNPGTCSDTFGTRVPASGGFDLGSGSTAAAYSEDLGGLTPGTTYYFCAVASNGVGTAYGSVLSFSTANLPSVTTNAASALATTGATLNGAATPRGAATTGWFRWSATNPGACDDTFGTRAPATGGTSLGSGSAAVAYTQALTGLTAGTTYYFCAVAENSVGKAFGTVQSFRTLSPPTVTTVAASAINGSAATLNGSANPNGAAAIGWFRYGTTSPGASCNDTFGTRTPATGGTSLGSGSSAVTYNAPLTGLAAGTTYYFCALASNSAGTAFGTPLIFTTPSAPVVTTVAATSVTGQGATLNGSATTGGAATTGWFRYATSNPGTCSDTFGTRTPATGGSDLGSGSTAQAYSQAVTGLTPATTYYFCAIAQNSVGTRFGTVRTFTTQAGPAVTTLAASAVTGTGATLNGSGNPNGVATTAWFRWSATSPGACNDTFGTRTPASGGSSLGTGTSTVPFSQALTGLTAGTTYYFCAIAQSAVGTNLGTLQSFVTPGLPAATTLAATAISGVGATLNGQATGNGAATTAWFRYATTNPGTCDDLFGVRAPLSGGTNVGAGTTPAAFSAVLTGLTPATTYFFCAIAQNSQGTRYGAVLSFTTLAAPTVTTLAATAVAGSQATLNATANPGGLAATGWFRYATTAPSACDDSFGTRTPATGGTSLGSGSAAVPFTAALTGLVPGTTYHYCALASNSVGTSFGAVMTFTTPAALPVVTTAAPTLVTGTSATFHAQANPGGAAATGWFRYATTAPAACDDAFGTRLPATGGTALGSGTSDQPFAEAVTGLAAGTTYYVCAIAQSVAGTGFGTPVSFTTPDRPVVSTQPATQIASTSARLNGRATPNRSETTGWFRWSATEPTACDDSFGTRVPETGGTALGTGTTDVDFAQDLAGLAPGTTYWFCALAQNAEGTSFGAVQTLRTPGVPVVTTSSATEVGSTSATLNGSAVPNGADAIGWFRWATTDPGSCNDTFGARAPATGGTALGAGTDAVPFTQALAWLAPGTTVWFCALAQNAVGIGYGTLLSVKVTSPVPVVETQDATDVDGTSAVLHATVNPSGTAATGWFRYATTEPTGGCSDSFGKRAPATGGIDVGSGTTASPLTLALTDLRPNTRYWFCAVASNVGGAGLGTVLSFETAAMAPTVATQEPTVSGGVATLLGTVNPNGAATTGWFQIDTTEPAKCDASFGRKVPTEGLALGEGTAEVPLWTEVSDLTQDTTYWYCAAASSKAGTAFGKPVKVLVPATKVASQGCGCDAASGSMPALLGLGLALLAMGRRRRS